ncbi:MAG: HAD family hydrolase [Myxococcota bacterium]|nr:HAD family hydrolase [Myxococcota bacterium]
MIQYWIFDMDGTITVPKHDFDEIRTRLGLTAGKDILKEIERLPETRRAKAHEELRDWEEEIAYKGEAAPDAKELLDFLHQRGSSLAVLTRNTKKLAHITLAQAGLQPYFTEPFILGRDCAKPKPEPDGILHITNLWNVKASECMMVGDYIHDVAAGRNAGCTTTFIQRQYILEQPALADYNCRDLRSLIPLMKDGLL